jgi:hypothetical protein
VKKVVVTWKKFVIIEVLCPPFSKSESNFAYFIPNEGRPQGLPGKRSFNHERSCNQRRQFLSEVSAAQPRDRRLLAKGLCERIGIDGKFTYKPQVGQGKKLDAVDVAMPTHSEAIQAVLGALVDKDNGVIASMKEIDAVGHRVVSRRRGLQPVRPHHGRGPPGH